MLVVVGSVAILVGVGVAYYANVVAGVAVVVVGAIPTWGSFFMHADEWLRGRKREAEERAAKERAQEQTGVFDFEDYSWEACAGEYARNVFIRNASPEATIRITAIESTLAVQREDGGRDFIERKTPKGMKPIDVPAHTIQMLGPLRIEYGVARQVVELVSMTAQTTRGPIAAQRRDLDKLLEELRVVLAEFDQEERDRKFRERMWGDRGWESLDI